MILKFYATKEEVDEKLLDYARLEETAEIKNKLSFMPTNIAMDERF